MVHSEKIVASEVLWHIEVEVDDQCKHVQLDAHDLFDEVREVALH